jgi:hypothetical protein
VERAVFQRQHRTDQRLDGLAFASAHLGASCGIDVIEAGLQTLHARLKDFNVQRRKRALHAAVVRSEPRCYTRLVAQSHDYPDVDELPPSCTYRVTLYE